MPVAEMLSFVPAFAVVMVRLGAMMIFAPLFGSSRIPRRVRALLLAAMALGMTGALPRPVALPDNLVLLAVAIGGELAFGLAMGMVLSFTFIAAQWAGEIIGQQMALNMSEVFDPQFGSQGSLVGDLYFFMMLAVFLAVGGHHAMLSGVFESFRALPPLSVGVSADLLGMMVGLFQGCTTLAIQLAAPMLVTMLVMDLALGILSKSVPQINVMTAGVTVRSLVGMGVIILGLVLSSDVMTGALMDAMDRVRLGWTTGLPG